MTMFLTILAGVPTTVLITVAALGIGMLGGIPFVLGRRSRFRSVRIVSRLLIEVLRGIPPLIWLFLIFFGFGASMTWMSALMASAFGLGLISCAYMAEIYRGGLSAISAGQWEAAEALGMSHRSVLAKVIGPQVFRVSIPAAATYGIGLLKDSSVVFTIGVTDIMFRANNQSHQTSDALTPFLIAGFVYIIITIPCAWGSRSLDANLKKRVAR